METYLDVLSNDTLTHKALSGSPETLCAKIVASIVPAADHGVGTTSDPVLSVGGDRLTCQTCEELSNQSSFVTQSSVEDDLVGQAWMPSTEDAPFVPEAAAWEIINDEPDDEWFVGERTAGRQRKSSAEKIAVNYTRDGVPIHNGFEVQITAQEAARIPFLDFARVSVSDKRICPDCGQNHWLSKIASCDQCGQMKCLSCMEDVGLSSFIGMCKTCASADPDITYETNYEDLSTDPNRYLSYFLSEGQDQEPDELFLPSGDF